MKKWIIVLVLAVSAIAGGYAQTEMEEMRGFLFQVGLGAATVEYDSTTEAEIDIYKAAGYDRMTIYLDLGLGFAITQKAYLLFSISGTGDRLEKSADDYLQLNTCLFAGGVRYYPFTTGLVLGADIGGARAVTQFGGGTSDITSDWGNGYRFMIGYDFARRLRGFTGILGLAITGSTIEDETINSAQIYFDLAWK